MRPAGVLVAVTLAAAAVVAGPLGLLFGPGHWWCGLAAVAAVLPPAVGTLMLTRWWASKSPFGGLFGMAVGVPVRVLAAMAAGAAVFFAARAGGDVADLGHPLKFWLWVLGVYLVTLVAETVLLAGESGSRRV